MRFTVKAMGSKTAPLFLALSLSLAIAPTMGRAEDAGAQGDAAVAAPANVHPAGIAGGSSEAPGSTGLVALPGESVPPHAQVTAQGMNGDAAGERSMAFNANGGECRDTIPGGPVLAAAYALILLMLGGYAVLLGRKNASLSSKIDELEKILAKRAASAESKGA